MILKNEDGFNFIRDFPFIFAREAMVATHRLFFAPKTLVAIPMTIKLLPETLRKRRAAKGNQKMNPRALRSWLDGGNRPQGKRGRELGSAGTAAFPTHDDRHPGAG
jgi:hypothetical protein